MKNIKFYTDNNFLPFSDVNFTKLYKAILEACDATEFPEGTFTRDGNPWKELIEVCEELFSDGVIGMFWEAAYRIMWGVPFVEYDEEREEIIRLVIHELLTDGPAFYAWDSCDCLRLATIEVCDSIDARIMDDITFFCTVKHYDYLKDKMMCRIFCSKSRYSNDFAYYAENVRKYESIINKLIPVSITWDEDFWIDENHIHDEIVNLYGVDYRKDNDPNHKDYNQLVLLLNIPYRDRRRYLFFEAFLATRIKNMPFALAQVIWPDDTENKIIRVFRKAYREAGRTNGNPVVSWAVWDANNIRDSFACKLLYEWKEDDTRDARLKKRVKTLLFNASTTI